MAPLLLLLVLPALALGKMCPTCPPTNPPFCSVNCSGGLFFASAFGDHVVLQRAPAAAAVYGVLVGAGGGSSVAVSVAPSDGGAAYTVQAAHVDRVNASYSRWKAVLPPTAASQPGASVKITATAGKYSATLKDVVFGDVWICSGQSNMWLPMEFSLSRNVTYDKIRKGQLQNIRLNTVSMLLPFDENITSQNFDPWVGLPNLPYNGAAFEYPGGGWQLPTVGDYAGADTPVAAHLVNASVDKFSAACWYFAEGITEMAAAKNESIVPLGLISTSWGGTIVESWTSNSTMKEEKCSYYKGNATHDYSGKIHGGIPSGGLYNGMIAPYINTTIRGALWYQGENNCFQCPPSADGDPDACGHASEHTGYGCFMQQMVEQWRDAWSSTPGSTTDKLFPFGIVSLAGGTSEGRSWAMPAFRNAQTAGGGLLPSKNMPNTFIAQGFDAAEPAGEGPGTSCELNDMTAEGGFPCKNGYAPWTPFFMGGIHPRAKRVIGQRLATAARHLVYGDKQLPYTGPVLKSCVMTRDACPTCVPDPKHHLCNGNMCGPRLELTFDERYLLNDTLSVRQSGWEMAIHGPPNPHKPYPMSLGARGQPFLDLQAAGLLTATKGSELLETLTKTWRPGAPGGTHRLLYTGELEVRYGGSLTNLSDGGIWLSARLIPKCFGRADAPCGWNTTTHKREPDFNIAEAALPLGSLNSSSITAVRYAWQEDPCCPQADRSVAPCPPNSCPLQTHAGRLPAVPFLAKIEHGSCTWNSISDAPMKKSMKMKIDDGTGWANWAWRSAQLAKMPAIATLHAPYTPYTNDELRTLNATQSLIDAQAKLAASFGVNVIWVVGGMSQFDALSVSERKTLVAAWVSAKQRFNLTLYIIAHVGTDIVSDAREMAAHAAAVGADAISSVPPYYETPSSVANLISWLAQISAAAPKLPLFYYHIPSSTHAPASITVHELLKESSTKLPALLGVKYVSSDMMDWYNSIRDYNDTHALLFAPEPKLQSFATGLGRGAVLAEDFYAPTYLRMQQHYARGEHAAARAEQQWKFDTDAVFKNFPGQPKRSVYKRLNGVDLGPPRLPQLGMNSSLEASLFAELEPHGFFAQRPPS